MTEVQAQSAREPAGTRDIDSLDGAAIAIDLDATPVPGSGLTAVASDGCLATADLDCGVVLP